MERGIDQCQGRRPFRAVFVHGPGDERTAHAVFYNARAAVPPPRPKTAQHSSMPPS